MDPRLTPSASRTAHPLNLMAKQRVEIDEEIARHPHLLQIERIVRIAPLMTEAERAALTDWAEDAVESLLPFDASNWPGWTAVARRLAH